jgi:hypothetical protein
VLPVEPIEVLDHSIPGAGCPTASSNRADFSVWIFNRSRRPGQHRSVVPRLQPPFSKRYSVERKGSKYSLRILRRATRLSSTANMVEILA